MENITEDTSSLCEPEIVSANSSAVFINKKNHLILIEYVDKKSGKKKPKLIGGKSENGENGLETITREADEELGIVLETETPLKGESVLQVDDGFRNAEIKKYHEKNIYIFFENEWKINRVAYQKSLYKNQWGAYSIRTVWNIIDSSQRKLLANSLIVLFSERIILKTKYYDVWEKVTLFKSSIV